MRTLPAIVAVLTLAAECAAGPPRATITVDHLVALIDQAIDVRVDGLPARAKVVLTATAVDGSNQTWRSTATVTADGSGAIDLDEAVPSAGTYTGTDGMGLFRSMLGNDGSRQVAGRSSCRRPGPRGAAGTGLHRFRRWHPGPRRGRAGPRPPGAGRLLAKSRCPKLRYWPMRMAAGL